MKDLYLYLKKQNKTALYKDQMWKLIFPEAKKSFAQFRA